MEQRPTHVATLVKRLLFLLISIKSFNKTIWSLPNILRIFIKVYIGPWPRPQMWADIESPSDITNHAPYDGLFHWLWRRDISSKYFFEIISGTGNGLIVFPLS